MRVIFFLFWITQGFAAFQLTWGIPAVSLDSNPPPGDTDIQPTVAIDPEGNAVAAWERTVGRGASADIWAACYHHSSRTWTGALRISGGGNSSHVSVAMDPIGNAIFLWEEGFPTQIFYRTLTPEGVWTPPLQQAPLILSESMHAQTFPQVAIDERGNALALWREYLGGCHHIQSAKKNDNSSWENLGTISSPVSDATLPLLPPLVLNGKGDGIAVWEEANGNIFGARFLSGSWMPSLLIGSGKEPSVSIDEKGQGVVVWNQAQMIVSKRWLLDGLSEPQFISHPNCFAQRPCVRMDQEGNALTVYERLDVARMHKFISGAEWKINEAIWSAPLDISAPSPSSVMQAGFPVLSMNAIGDGVVIWKEYDEGKIIIQGAGYSLGTWSFIRTLSAKNAEAGMLAPGYDVSLSVNLAGNIMAVWPEDPSGRNTPHIKSAPGTGLAVMGPKPPMLIAAQREFLGIGTGSHEIHHFPAHSDHFYALEWTSPGGVAYFNIYRGSLSCLIGTSTSPRYEDHQRKPGKTETYLITSVDSHGHESGPITILAHPKT